MMRSIQDRQDLLMAKGMVWEGAVSVVALVFMELLLFFHVDYMAVLKKWSVFGVGLLLFPVGSLGCPLLMFCVKGGKYLFKGAFQSI